METKVNLLPLDLEDDLEPRLQCWGGGGDGSNTCGDAAAVDSAAIGWLNAVPSPEPFERGRPIWCKEFPNETFRPVSTNETVSEDDPCIVGIAIVPHQLAGSHTHPFFRSAAEADGCFGQKNIRSDAVAGINRDNIPFGSDDAAYVTTAPKLPLYMRVPKADVIKVLPLTGQPRVVWTRPQP